MMIAVHNRRHTNTITHTDLYELVFIIKGSSVGKLPIFGVFNSPQRKERKDKKKKRHGEKRREEKRTERASKVKKGEDQESIDEKRNDKKSGDKKRKV